MCINKVNTYLRLTMNYLVYSGPLNNNLKHLTDLFFQKLLELVFVSANWELVNPNPAKWE